ncbi:hypothetical protein [Hoeflea sp.]|uniref:hypothetical protein n=1 Tax=Hoeflea sp. TaxID=1940281 RepID=UPI003B017B8F
MNPALIDGQTSLFIDYCLDRISGELSEWDVVVPFNRGRKTDFVVRENLGTDVLPLRSRNSGAIKKVSDSEVFKPTGDRNSIRDPNEDPPLLLSAARRRKAEVLKEESSLRGDRPFCAVRTRPLMLVHFFKAEIEDPRFRLKDTPIVSLSFCMPETEIPVLPRTYEVNTVFRRQIETLSTETDEDESMLDD